MSCDYEKKRDRTKAANEQVLIGLGLLKKKDNTQPKTKNKDKKESIGAPRSSCRLRDSTPTYNFFQTNRLINGVDGVEDDDKEVRRGSRKRQKTKQTLSFELKPRQKDVVCIKKAFKAHAKQLKEQLKVHELQKNKDAWKDSIEPGKSYLSQDSLDALKKAGFTYLDMQDSDRYNDSVVQQYRKYTGQQDNVGRHWKIESLNSGGYIPHLNNSLPKVQCSGCKNFMALKRNPDPTTCFTIPFVIRNHRCFGINTTSFPQSASVPDI